MKFNEIKLTPLLDTLRLQKISDEVYFSEKYSGYVSNSRLGLLNPKQDGSPEKFFAGFKPVGYAPALILGSSVHELTLQPDLFELAPDLGKPTAKMGAMADELYSVFLEGDVTKSLSLRLKSICFTQGYHFVSQCSYFFCFCNRSFDFAVFQQLSCKVSEHCNSVVGSFT